MRGFRRRCAAAVATLALPLGACAEATPSIAFPWPDRPVVHLEFAVADDLESVAGWERIVFTPDLPTCEVVLRSWPNKPATARAGSSLVVSEVRIDGRAVDFQESAAGAPESAPAGTLLEVPLAGCAEAGEQITVELDFVLALGTDVDERVGTSSTADVAWFATAFPLLAWERGRGWERAPAVAVTGEMAVSEDFRLDSLEVVAPSRYEVLGTGESAGTAEGPREGTTVHRFTAPTVRDVAVSVGDLRVVEAEIGGIRVHLGADRNVRNADLQEWLQRIETSLQDLVDLLGPFPYRDLWVTVLSSQTSGVEFPGAIQFGDVNPEERRGLVTHELAHMWFYGWVGSDQGEHPWLDESFATFAQMVADGQAPARHHLRRPVHAPDVGGSMSYWAEFPNPSRTYYDTVYTIGGTALVEARNRAGPEEFDTALRKYVRSNAFSIATPDDVEAAFAELPEVLAVLRQVGALP